MDAPTLAGRTLGSYLVGELLGQGGMGVVYKARDRRRERDVALKTLHSAATTLPAAERLRREARWLFHCDAPHIVRVYDAGWVDGIDYIAMELMATTLQARIAHGGRPTLAEWMDVATGVLGGLAAAHAVGVIHRDVKPANVGFAIDGTVKLLDFGLASPLPWNPHIDDLATTTSGGACAGTMHYMSPEQLCGDPVDERTDVYSAGAVLYELATGRRPFRQSGMARLIDEILNREPVAPSALNWSVPPAVDAVILRALAKRRADRFQSAVDMMDAVRDIPALVWGPLFRLQHGQPAPAGPSTPTNAASLPSTPTRGESLRAGRAGPSTPTNHASLPSTPTRGESLRAGRAGRTGRDAEKRRRAGRPSRRKTTGVVRVPGCIIGSSITAEVRWSPHTPAIGSPAGRWIRNPRPICSRALEAGTRRP